MGEALSPAGEIRTPERLPKQEYFCLTCGELFEAEVPADKALGLPACPSCAGRDVERQKPVADLPRPASRFDRGMCACEIAALSPGAKNRK